MSHLSDGLCTYIPAEGAPILDVSYQFDNSFEVFDEQGLARAVKTVLLPKARIDDCGRQDSVSINGTLWHYNGTIEDDGYFVRIEVTT